MIETFIVLGLSLIIVALVFCWILLVHAKRVIDEMLACARLLLSAINLATKLNGPLAGQVSELRADRDTLIDMITACGDDAARQWIADRYATQAKEKMH